MNSAFMLALAESSLLRRSLRKASISSIKIIEGASLRAKLNVACTIFCDSPNHMFMAVDIFKLIKAAPDSLAMALASMVLPVPGGPYNSTPLGGCSKFDLRP